MLFKILEKICTSNTLTSLIIKFIIRGLDKIFKFKVITLLKTNSTLRPNYTYSVYHAASLAKRLNHESVSVIEFGVATGRGVLFLENIAERIGKELKINIEIYGFDLGNGLSAPKNFKDLPYWFQAGFYKMNKNLLKKKLKITKLIIGDVKHSVNFFLKNYKHAPIGAIFNDLDYYHSTINSFKIFNSPNLKKYLPRIFLYFDDIVGTELEMYNSFSGELLAIKEFNIKNKNKKITQNQNLISSSNEKWRYQIYYFHNFKHHDYNKFIGFKEQNEIINKMNK
jgi:hypothetical protein